MITRFPLWYEYRVTFDFSDTLTVWGCNQNINFVLFAQLHGQII